MKKIALTLSILLSGAALAQSTSTAPATTPATTAPATAPAPSAAPKTEAPKADAPKADPAAILARIGKEDVTLGEFERDFRVAVARVVNAQGMPLDDEILKQFESAKAGYFKDYIRQRETYQMAVAAGIKADKAAVDASYDKAKANFKTDAEFTQALAQTGFASAEDFRASLEHQNVMSAYLKGIQDKFKFGDSMVSSFYNLHKSSFATPAQACAKHILVATKAEADTIIKDLDKGGDFAKIAKDKSKDPGSAAQGGDLGCFGPGQMVASFDKASFSGPLNKAQEVQSEFGWHVLMVSKRVEAGVRSLEDVAPLIRQKLSSDAAQKYLDSQVARLKVEMHPELLPAAPAPAQK